MLTALFRILYLVFHVNRTRHHPAFFRELSQLSEGWEEPLEKRYINRLSRYTMFSCITNEWFSALRGYPVSTTETKAGIYLGAFTPVYDDLMDDLGYSGEDMQALIKHRQSKTPHSLEKLFIYLHEKLLVHLPENSPFHEYFMELGSAQSASHEQLNPEISTEALHTITFDKGGLSLLLYRSILAHAWKAGEKEAIYYLGGVIQYINDIFDVYEDLQQGIKTLPNSDTSVIAIRNTYANQLHEVKRLFSELDYPKRNIRKFLHQMMVIMSRGFVCLDQFQTLEAIYGSPFAPAGYSREEMICDMEKPGNLIRSLWYCFRHPS